MLSLLKLKFIELFHEVLIQVESKIFFRWKTKNSCFLLLKYRRNTRKKQTSARIRALGNFPTFGRGASEARWHDAAGWLYREPAEVPQTACLAALSLHSDAYGLRATRKTIAPAAPTYANSAYHGRPCFDSSSKRSGITSILQPSAHHGRGWKTQRRNCPLSRQLPNIG